MAAKTSDLNKNLGFDSSEFELIIKKPSDNLGLIKCERKINSKVLREWSEENKVASELGERLRKTIESFLESSYKTLIINGKLFGE